MPGPLDFLATSMLYFGIWSTAVAFLLVKSAESVDVLHKVTFENGRCNTNLGKKAQGETFYDDITCVKYTCASITNSIRITECPKFIVDLSSGKCRILPGRSGRYPVCCDRPVCGKGIIPKGGSATRVKNTGVKISMKSKPNPVKKRA